jgi:hypothetical protein
MAYTNIDFPAEYFDTKLYTGTGAAQSISGLDFAPDFVWIKRRGSAEGYALFDAVRGATKRLFSDRDFAESIAATTLTSFNSDGFSLGGNDATNGVDNYASWNWLAGGTGVSNTDGTITSTVSANTTSGFSIVSYTGTGSAATIGHGLGAVPRMIMVKNRDAGDAWQVYHAANTANPETDYLVLNEDAATADNINRWNDTLPTSTLFSIGDGVEVNTNTEDYIAYCFADVKGYSKFGGYTGNGNADGTFVYTGFKPAFVLIKRTDGIVSWRLMDNKRDPYNVMAQTLQPNSSAAEVTENASGNITDSLSNGFKIRATGASANASGGTYIYMAFAENPFVTSSGIPTTAR